MPDNTRGACDLFQIKKKQKKKHQQQQQRQHCSLISFPCSSVHALAVKNESYSELKHASQQWLSPLHFSFSLPASSLQSFLEHSQAFLFNVFFLDRLSVTDWQRNTWWEFRLQTGRRSDMWCDIKGSERLTRAPPPTPTQTQASFQHMIHPPVTEEKQSDPDIICHLESGISKKEKHVRCKSLNWKWKLDMQNMQTEALVWEDVFRKEFCWWKCSLFPISHFNGVCWIRVHYSSDSKGQKWNVTACFTER